MTSPSSSPAHISHSEILLFLWRYVRPYRLMLMGMTITLLLSTGLQLVQPFFYKEVVDAIVGGTAGDAVVLRRAMLLVIVGVLCGILRLTLHEGASRMLGWMETRVMERVHGDAFAHVQRLSTQFHVNAFAGATARKIARGTDALETMVDRLWFNFLPLFCLTIGYIIVLAFFAPLIGLTIAGSILLYAPISIGFNLVLARYHAWTDRQDTRVTASLVDAITGNAAVKSFAAEAREDARHGKVLREWRDRLYRTWGIGVLMTWTQFMLLMVIEMVLLLLAVYLWYLGSFTAGGFVIVVFYVGHLWGYLFDIGQQVRNYLRAAAHAEEMITLMNMPHDVADPPGAVPLRMEKGEIVFDRVTFRYSDQGAPLAAVPDESEEEAFPTHSVFKDFSLTIRPGEKVALVGHSGGGKSTFVKLLLRFYDTELGFVRIDGQDVSTVTQESLRNSIALVPQDPTLFHRSLAENIAYGKPNVSSADIERVAKLAHAHEFISALPKGYETLVGERGVKLSGGERQRVAIARAILADTPILILDEATSSLDALSEKYIQESLAYLMEGRTTIVIAHRLSTIKRVDRILVLEDGKIMEEGPHAELVKKEGGLYRHFYELQAGGFIGE